MSCFVSDVGLETLCMWLIHSFNHFRVTQNLQDPGSTDPGAWLTSPCCLRPGGAPAWREILDFKAEWNQTLDFVGKELKWRGGEWIKSGSPCPWSHTIDAHRWKALDLHSSTKMDGLFDRESVWSGKRGKEKRIKKKECTVRDLVERRTEGRVKRGRNERRRAKECIHIFIYSYSTT